MTTNTLPQITQITHQAHDPLLVVPPIGMFDFLLAIPLRTRDSDDAESNVDFDNDENVANPPY